MQKIKNKEKAYESWWWLIENHEWAIHNLEISPMKVNPKTKIQEDDMELNTHIEFWVESGAYTKEMGAYHDTRLDCGGDSWEEAIINLARLVRKFYGKQTDLWGKKIKCKK